MPFITPLTKLDAVNELLASIGQSPVSTLASSAAIGDVGLAIQFLDTVTRSVQLHGFNFNTDENYQLSPDAEGLIRVPEGILKLLPSAGAQSQLKQRRHPNGDWCIWDGDNQTWTFTGPVTFNVVWGFVFDDLPETARDFITISAGRKFQMKTIGAQSLDGYAAEDEHKSWVTLQREERAQRNTNVFRRNTTMAASTNNRRY